LINMSNLIKLSSDLLRQDFTDFIDDLTVAQIYFCFLLTVYC